MKKSIVLAWIFFAVFSISLVHGKILLSQPNSIYNLGEILNLSIKITGQVDGIIETKLICDKEQLFYLEYLSLEENKELNLVKGLKLKDNSGLCYIQAKLNNEVSKTSSFLISKKINIETNLNKEYLSPQENLEIKGNAIKESGGKISGTLKIYLDNTLLKESEIRDSEFSEKLNLPSYLKEDEYYLVLRATDKENLNFGEINRKVHIFPTPSSLEIKLSQARAGENLSLEVFLYSMHKEEMKKNISIIITNPEKKEVFKKQAISSERVNLFLPDNSTIGDYKVKAIYDDLEEENHFYIDKNEKISTTLEGDILTIKNIGNAPYKKTISIEIKNSTSTFTQELSINLNIGEEQKIKISAYPGEYKIKIREQTFDKVRLTGSSISVENLSEKSVLKSPFFAFLIIILLFLAITFLSHSGLRKEVRKLGRIFEKEAEEKKYIEVKLGKTEKEKEKIQTLFGKYVDKEIAEKAISDKLKQGKHEASFLFTDIRGYIKMSEKPEQTIEILNRYFQIITQAVHLQGGVISQIVGDCVEAMFNITKEQPDHVLKAVKAAIKIKKDIENFNKTKILKDEIKTGIGIDFGNVYLSSIGVDVKRYQPIGPAVNIAYNLSKHSSNQVFITKNTYEKIKDSIKAKKLDNIKVKDKEIEVYEVLI